MKTGIGAAITCLTLAAAALSAPTYAIAAGTLGTPRATEIGTFGGIAYVQYDGVFAGWTSTGEYRVPYRITAPAIPVRGNRTVVVEPPHFAVGLGALEQFLGRSFLFSRGFVHAGVGWSTASFGKDANLRILDPTVSRTFIKGGFHDKNGRTDDEIIVDFARALSYSQEIGGVDRRYAIGFSDSSDPVLRLVTSGRAAGVFDFALPITAEGHDPVAALAAGRYGGKLLIVNSEAEATSGLFDLGRFRNQYRHYLIAGTAHVPDFLGPPFFSSRSTPASYVPQLHAHFLQGDSWVKGGPTPPQSIQLKASGDGTLVRDINGNAISLSADGQPVPRLPFVEIGEARFITGFVGSYDNVKTVGDLGFKSHKAYRQAFEDKLADYVRAGFILKEDADAMRGRAGLCPPLTFTQTYRDHYDAFIAISPCGG